MTARHLAAVTQGWQKGSPACLHPGPAAGSESWVLGLAWEEVDTERGGEGRTWLELGASNEDHDIRAVTQVSMRSRSLGVIVGRWNSYREILNTAPLYRCLLNPFVPRGICPSKDCSHGLPPVCLCQAQWQCSVLRKQRGLLENITNVQCTYIQ